MITVTYRNRCMIGEGIDTFSSRVELVLQNEFYERVERVLPTNGVVTITSPDDFTFKESGE